MYTKHLMGHYYGLPNLTKYTSLNYSFRIIEKKLAFIKLHMYNVKNYRDKNLFKLGEEYLKYIKNNK